MKSITKYSLLTLALTSMCASAATTLSQPLGGNNGAYSFQSLVLLDTGFTLTGDAFTGFYDLDSVTFVKGNNDNAGPVAVFLNVYEATNLSLIGSSNNSVDWSGTGIAQGGSAVYDFTDVTGVDGLTDGNPYIFQFSETQGGILDDFVSVRLDVGTRGTDNPETDPLNQSPIALGNLSSSINFDANMSVDITTGVDAAIPEPSSTALLGLGGLALIMRRRR